MGDQQPISLVVPMLDATHRVGPIHRELEQVLDSRPGSELVLVDDASVDSTWERVGELAGRDERVVGLRLVRNVGQTGALCAGMSVARNPVVVIMDDDLEFTAADIDRFVAAVRTGADFASGRRIGWRRPLRALPSRVYNARLRQWGLPFHDAGCGLNAMTLELAHRISGLGWGVRQHRFKPAVARLTDHIVEVPFEVRPTRESHHGVTSLAVSWLDVEVHFGPRTRSELAAAVLGVPAAVLAVALLGRPWRRTPVGPATRAARSLTAVGAFVGLVWGSEVFRRQRDIDRRTAKEPPFAVAESINLEPAV